MAEASHRLHQPRVGAMADVIHLPTSLSSDEIRFAVVVLAQRAARGAVKRQLQRGVSLLSHSEISSRAKELQCQSFDDQSACGGAGMEELNGQTGSCRALRGGDGSRISCSSETDISGNG
jgi:hypothetical protein